MTSLNPLHTIDRQIGETLMLHRGMSKSEARARALELLHLVRLQEAEERLGAYPHQLSGGQRQRVMIAMALANEPDLLIADEPTTALDVTIQAQILKLLKDLQQRLGMAMLLITHDLTIVRKIADRVCVMTDGRIVETGAVEDVFARPGTLHAAPSGGGAEGQAARAPGRRAGGHRGAAGQGALPDPARPAAPHGRLRQGGRRRRCRDPARSDGRRGRRAARARPRSVWRCA